MPLKFIARLFKNFVKIPDWGVTFRGKDHHFNFLRFINQLICRTNIVSDFLHKLNGDALNLVLGQKFVDD